MQVNRSVLEVAMMFKFVASVGVAGVFGGKRRSLLLVE